MAMIVESPLRRFFKKSLIPLFFLLHSFACCFPLLKDLLISCRGDWDFFSSLHEISSLTLFEYQQFPLWNPYHGGGVSLIGNPQAGFPSPIFFATALFGVFAGLKISVWLHTFLGLWGMWLLAGHLGLKGPSRLIPSLIFMFSSSWALHLTEGHMVWLPAAYLPFLFLTFLKGLQEKRWLLLAGIIESVMFYEGGTYVFAFSVLFIAVYAAFYSLEIRSFQPLLANMLVNIIAIALSAPKLLPALELLGGDPRPISAGSPHSWDDILAFLLDRQAFNSWDTGAYIGLTVIALYLLSLSLYRQQRPLILTSFFMLLLVCGNFSPYSPWTLLHELPLFSSFKVPTRALIVFIFPVALLVGLFLGTVERSRDRRIKYIVWIMVLFVGTDLFLVSQSIFRGAAKAENFSFLRADFKVDQVSGELYRVSPAQTTGLGRSVASVHQPFQQVRVPDLDRFVHGGYSAQYLPLLKNQGVINAYEPIRFSQYARAVTDTDYLGEYYLSGQGDLKLLSWSPNKLVFHVVLREDGRLVINQNYSSGWRVSTGVLSRLNGLLAVNLSAGEHDVVLRYLPKSYLLGIGVFLTTLGGIFLCFRKFNLGFWNWSK